MEFLLFSRLVLKRHWPFFIACALLGLLLWRNPFSPVSEIFDFRPHPDSFHFALRAWNLVQGHGFKFFCEGREIFSSFSLFYSLLLVPVYAIWRDPHAFYFSNVLLSFASLGIFYRILGKLNFSAGHTFLLLFLLLTNGIFFTFPTVAMPENLILFLSVLAIYWLVQPVTLLRSFGAGLCAVGFFAAKYSAAPFTVVYFFLYGVKIFWGMNGRSRKTALSVFLSVFFIAFISFSAFEYAVKRTSPLDQLVEVFSQIFLGRFTPGILSTVEGSHYFKREAFGARFLTWCGALFWGAPIPFLTSSVPMFPAWVGIGGVLGLGAGAGFRRKRFLSVSLITLLLGPVIFFSFCGVLVRFFYSAVPIFLIGLGFLLEFFREKFNGSKYKRVFALLLTISILAGTIPQARNAMGEVRKNFQSEKEVSYLYGCVRELNDFFSDPKFNWDGKPLRLVTTIPPPLFDFYGKPDCKLMPFSSECDRLYYRSGIWGGKAPDKFAKVCGLCLDRNEDLYIVIIPAEESEGREVLQCLQEKFSLKLMKMGKFCHIFRLERETEKSSG